MHVKPKDDEIVIRYPASAGAKARARMGPEGDEVPETAYWMRRLQEGAVVLVEQEEPEAPPESPARSGGTTRKKRSRGARAE